MLQRMARQIMRSRKGGTSVLTNGNDRSVLEEYADPMQRPVESTTLVSGPTFEVRLAFLDFTVEIRPPAGRTSV